MSQIASYQMGASGAEPLSEQLSVASKSLNSSTKRLLEACSSVKDLKEQLQGMNFLDLSSECKTTGSQFSLADATRTLDSLRSHLQSQQGDKDFPPSDVVTWLPLLGKEEPPLAASPSLDRVRVWLGCV
mmetsp:Transcript_6836/g.15763  ORF Transcript_6836/g.15763 Transcript_6836/m.15763 type:complete len:129 (-) Transcript_6836:543-929(-)